MILANLLEGGKTKYFQPLRALGKLNFPAEHPELRPVVEPRKVSTQ